MKKRLTRQGIPDLDAVGHNGHRRHGARCRHWFAGPRIVIGTRWVMDPDDYEAYEAPIYGQKCAWCPVIREEED